MSITKSAISPIAIVVFDIDGVIRDVTSSHFRAMSDTVKYFTEGLYYPSQEDIDNLLFEGLWNNDYDASQELIYRYYESKGKPRDKINLNHQSLIAFFEKSYWGDDSSNSLGYIDNEQLLVSRSYFDSLTDAGILWGFFSGATRLSVKYVLEKRLGLASPLLFAVEDGPGKPEPMGLLWVVEQLETSYQLKSSLPVIFAGDTTADQETINRVKKIKTQRKWIGVGVLPPHIHKSPQKTDSYKSNLIQTGATEIILSIEYLNPEKIASLIQN